MSTWKLHFTQKKKSCTQVTQYKQLLKRKRNLIKTISTFWQLSRHNASRINCHFNTLASNYPKKNFSRLPCTTAACQIALFLSESVGFFCGPPLTFSGGHRTCWNLPLGSHIGHWYGPRSIVVVFFSTESKPYSWWARGLIFHLVVTTGWSQWKRCKITWRCM